MSFAGGDGFLQRRAVHPRHHQHAPGGLLLHDGGDQAIGVEFQLVVKTHAREVLPQRHQGTKGMNGRDVSQRPRRRRRDSDVSAFVSFAAFARHLSFFLKSFHDARMAQFTELKEQVVVVTGGANGIGAATVRAFHEQGARVFFCDKDSNQGETLAKELGPAVSFQNVDLMSEGAILEWVAAIKRESKTIRALVNNAAWDPRIPFLETTSKQWDDLFALNLRAYFLVA